MHNHLPKPLLVGLKSLFGVLGLVAVVNEIVTLVGRGAFYPANFFSFFTIQSNIFAAVMFFVGAYAVIKGVRSRTVDALRGAASLYMGLTGVVFALLLSGLDPSVLTAQPWDNSILHYVIPVAALLDWIIDPPVGRIRVRTVLLWLIYPLLYLGYTLLRGPIAHWYPYPFINPDTMGYAKVLVTCGIITAGVVIGGFIIRARSLIGRTGGTR